MDFLLADSVARLSPLCEYHGILRSLWPFFLALLTPFVAEQAFLRLYLDRAVLERDDDFKAFIEDLRAQPGGLATVERRRCEMRPLLLGYSYQICVYANANRDGGYSLRLAQPSGWLSPIPNGLDEDRILWDGETVWRLSADGVVVQDYRSGQQQ